MVKFEAEPLDRVFHALADPTRRTMVERVAGGPCTVSDLAAPFDMSLPAALKHVRVLEEAGLLVTEKTGRERHCRLNPEPLGAAESWIDQTRREWVGRFQALDRFLAEFPEEDEEE
ncbi:MAG: ArsR/SmtB family transcription factor [Fimbriimonas sp.]